MDIDVECAVPDPHLEPVFRRRLAVLVGLTAISAAFLVWLETDSGRQEDKALVDASRSALEVFVKLGASGSRFHFEVDAARRSTQLDARSTGRVADAPVDNLRVLQLALAEAQAENEASRKLLSVTRGYRDLPGAAPGLDAAASESLRIRSERDVQPIYDAQDEALERAESYGTGQERAMYGVSLVAIAASLLGLAGLLGSSRGGRLALLTASLSLVVAVAVGMSGIHV